MGGGLPLSLPLLSASKSLVSTACFTCWSSRFLRVFLVSRMPCARVLLCAPRARAHGNVLGVRLRFDFYGAWRGVAWCCVAWRGVAWRVVAWRGVAWRVALRGVRACAAIVVSRSSFRDSLFQKTLRRRARHGARCAAAGACGFCCCRVWFVLFIFFSSTADRGCKKTAKIVEQQQRPTTTKTTTQTRTLSTRSRMMVSTSRPWKPVSVNLVASTCRSVVR